MMRLHELHEEVQRSIAAQPSAAVRAQLRAEWRLAVELSEWQDQHAERFLAMMADPEAEERRWDEYCEELGRRVWRWKHRREMGRAAIEACEGAEPLAEGCDCYFCTAEALAGAAAATDWRVTPSNGHNFLRLGLKRANRLLMLAAFTGAKDAE